jgi:hypothetical protein
MEPEGGKSSDRPLTDEQIAQQVINEIAVFCATSITVENESLGVDIAIIGAALDSRGIDNWMSVRSVINILEDQNEIDKFINGVPPTSKFHKNSVAVATLVRAFKRWLKEGIIAREDSMVKTFNILTERLEQNLALSDMAQSMKDVRNS